MKVTTIGVDLAKSVFQVHGVDGSGKTVVRKRLRRKQVLPFFAQGWAKLMLAATAHAVLVDPSRSVKFGR
jgi:hypothetical protein